MLYELAVLFVYPRKPAPRILGLCQRICSFLRQMLIMILRHILNTHEIVFKRQYSGCSRLLYFRCSPILIATTLIFLTLYKLFEVQRYLLLLVLTHITYYDK